MLLNVRNTQGIRVAIIDTDSIMFSCESDKNLEKLVQDCLTEGVLLKQEVISEDRNLFTVVGKKIDRTNEYFSLALKGFLTDLGYFVEDYRKEEEEELAQLIAVLPEDDEYRKEMEKRLPNLSRLERTTLIKVLRS